MKQRLDNIDDARSQRSQRLFSRMVTDSDDENEPSNKAIFSEMRTNSGREPKLRVGVLSDIQYAPVEDGHSYSGVPRYYRHALSTARVAAEHFECEKVDAVINLGDTVDGKCLDVCGGGVQALEDVLQALGAYKSGPILHTYGNHELYSLSREELADRLNIPFITEDDGESHDLVGYWSYLPQPGVRFIIIDSYDISLLARCAATSSKRKEAEKLLSMHNPNFPEAENSPIGLTGLQKRYVGFNGGVGTQQLEWLHQTLEHSRQCNEKVIILSHQPILPESSPSPVCLIWNYNDVLDIVRPYNDVILACLSGHAHRCGYKRDDESGIHFRVMAAVLETNAPNDTYAFMEIYDDRLVIEGYGDCESAVYDLNHVTENKNFLDEKCTPSSKIVG